MRLLLFGSAMLAFLALCSIFLNQATFQSLDSGKTWPALLLLGAVALWPLLFRRSAFLTVLTSFGIILATVIVAGGCGFFLTPTWCSQNGSLWLLLISVCTLYCIALVYVARGWLKEENWKEGFGIGLVPCVMYFLIFPLVAQILPKAGNQPLFLIGIVLQATIMYTAPVFVLFWLIHRMVHEKKNKNIKTALAM